LSVPPNTGEKDPRQVSGMKIRVTLFIGGRTFDEDVIVDRFEDASRVALVRNPTGRVINRKVIWD
tara:strand:- start:576 stop:770 length:195 start_codon:yes stop_codon:yes gene_type:complete